MRKNNKKTKKLNTKSFDGFTNEQRKTLLLEKKQSKMSKKICKYYYKKLKLQQSQHSNKNKMLIDYPLGDARTSMPILKLLKMNLNKDGSIKNGFKKKLTKCFKNKYC